MRQSAALVLALLTFGLAGCTGDDSGDSPLPQTSAHETDAGSISEPNRESPEDPAEALLKTVNFEGEIWLTRRDRLSWGTRQIPSSPNVLETVPEAALDSDNPRILHLAVTLSELFVGRAGEGRRRSSAIPPKTRLLDVEMDGTTATIDLNRAFESGGGSLSMQLRIAQIVFTATQFGGELPVDAVRFAIEGRPVTTLGGEGVLVEEPQTRGDWLDVAPNIVVTSPRLGDVVDSPVRVTGYANVFEANVNLRVLAGERLLLETFTTATCGSGCWGEFSKRLRFQISTPSPGRVEALTYSAEDGSPQDLIAIPVVLVPRDAP